MARTHFERPQRHTPVARGHKPDCLWEDNFGPSCECDGSCAETPESELVRKQIIWAMEMAGWVSEGKGAWLAFRRHFGHHRISVVRVASGWQVVWQRGVGWTILEDSNYGNVGICVTAVWEHMVAYHDQADEVLAENVKFRLDAAKREREAPPAAVLTSVPKED